MKPSKTLFVLVSLWFGLALLIALSKFFRVPGINSELLTLAETGWQVIGGVLILASLWDFIQARSLHYPITVTRTVPNNLAVGSWTDVELQFRHQLNYAMTIKVFDHYPSDADYDYLPQQVLLTSQRTSKLTYRIRPTKRGDVTFLTVQVLHSSPFKLWEFTRYYGEPSTVKVYSNFAAINHYILLATDNAISQLGIKLKQRRGEGLEFHQLREYREGDTLKQIDWKATARKRKLITKEHQDERDQQIIFLIDCGRRMRSQDDELNHFDHALNATLLLAYVALRQGDAVGMMSFSGDTQRWLAPQKGTSSINTLLNYVYDLHATTHASDYIAATKSLMQNQRKRAMVVLISNARDENTDDLLPALRLLQKRHLVVFANLREAVLDHTLEQPVMDFSGALRYSSAHQFLLQRKTVNEQLLSQGISALDTTSKELPIRLINHYFEIKRSGRL